MSNPNSDTNPNSSNQTATNDMSSSSTSGTTYEDEQFRRENEQEMQRQTIRAGKAIPRRALDSYWEEYFKKLNNDYLKRVVKEAPNDEYTVTFSDGSTKQYKRKKPSFKEFKDLELTRAKFEMLTDPKQKMEMLEAAADIYMKCAKCYFGMTIEEFETCSWEDIKLILDACNFRTLYGVPYSQTG